MSNKMVTGMQAKTGFNGAPVHEPTSTGTGNAGIVSEHDQKYVRSTCLRCWQKVVIAWKKGDYLKDKECPLCGGRLLGKVPVKKGDPDYPVLDTDATRATDFHCVALKGTNPFEFVSSAHELVRP